jgi:hypothetical protein
VARANMWHRKKSGAPQLRGRLDHIHRISSGNPRKEDFCTPLKTIRGQVNDLRFGRMDLDRIALEHRGDAVRSGGNLFQVGIFLSSSLYSVY